MKLPGKILSVLLLLLLVTSVFLWLLINNINSKKIKQLVNNQISALTHKKSQIDGAISWQLFPRPGLKFNKISIGEEQLNQDYLLIIDELTLNLKITPLLRGRYVFSEVNINGLKGYINLDASPEPKSLNTLSQPKNLDNNDQFAIDKLMINHGQVIIKNNALSTEFKNLQIGLEQFNFKNTPFLIHMKAKLNQYKSNPQIKASINFKGRLSLNSSPFHQLSNGFKQTSIDGQLQLQNILLNRLSIKKINAAIKTNKTHILFNPFTVSLYDGESIGNMDYSFSSQLLSLNQTATNLSAKQFIAALSGQEFISGSLDSTIHATIPFKNPSIESLVGNGSITIKNGEIDKLNLELFLNSLKTKLNDLTNNKLPVDKTALFNDWDTNKYKYSSTPFKLASIEYQFQKGNIYSNSILVQTEKFQAKGKGRLYLPGREINSNLQITLNSNSSDFDLQKTQTILGGFFPLVISGTIDNPEIRPDFNIMSQLWGQLNKYMGILSNQQLKPNEQLNELLK